jgi:signal transduction histidine kinase
MSEIPEAPREDAFVREIIDRFAQQLRAEDNALSYDLPSFHEVLEQARLIIGDTMARVGEPVQYAEADPGESELRSVEIGTARAKAGVHPIESLRAAALLYKVALPMVLSRGESAGTTAHVADVSVALYESVMDRIALASLSYVDFLMDKLRRSRQEERLRIARELHDRVGHSMALTLQSLDLLQHYAERDPARAELKLYEALASLTEAMQTVQQMSAELRRSVDKAGTAAALRAYMLANVPPAVTATLEVLGDEKLLPPNVSEELYLILREATRNALRHAEASEIRLLMEIGDDTVEASVADNGRGFQVESAAARPTGGLPSMRERAELLRGDLILTSLPGGGTNVRVTVPLDRRSL